MRGLRVCGVLLESNFLGHGLRDAYGEAVTPLLGSGAHGCSVPFDGDPLLGHRSRNCRHEGLARGVHYRGGQLDFNT